MTIIHAVPDMKPNYFELFGILIIGVLQPITEVIFGTQIATYYNGVAILIVLAYMIFRIRTSKENIVREWGFRLDTVQPSIVPYSLLVLVAGGALYGYGWLNGFTPLPTGFWYILGLYPLWGIAQQCVLQNVVAHNLRVVVPSKILRSLVTAAIFACAHIPSTELFIVTFIAGCIVTYMHDTYRNIITLGIAHGILGAMVFHLVLGQDQWGILVQYF